MKRRRKSRGAPPKNAARAHCDQLMKQRMGNSEACRIVGISRSSGTQWGHGHTVVLKPGDIKKYASISLRRPIVISHRFLSESERITIADLLHTGRSIYSIPMELGRRSAGTLMSPRVVTVLGRLSGVPSADGAGSAPGKSPATLTVGL